MKEYKAADKVVQKMTRAGAEIQNLATGSAENISSRPADDNVSEQPVNTAGNVLDRLDAEHTRHSSKKAVKRAQKIVNQGADTIKRPSSRLQFSDGEKAVPELQKAIRKSDKAADKLDKARLHFKDVEKPLNGKMKHTPLSLPLQEVGAAIHGKIREVEKENVGVEGGHAAERFGEKAAGKGYRLVKKSIRHQKLKPYRAAAKAERASLKANSDFMYRKALHDNPQLASNPLMQKQQIKRNYAKQIKNTGKTAKKAGSTAKSAATKAKAAAEKFVNFARRHWKVLLAIIAIGLVLVVLIGALQSCSSIFSGGVAPVVASSYFSDDADMYAAEAAYSSMEGNLQNDLNNTENLYPGYDEYRYDLDEIGHDPYVLISILSTLHEGVFTIDEVQSDLAMLFEHQYILTLTEEIEVRYRTETSTWTDDAGNTHTDTYEVAYNYYILHVKLENRNLSNIPVYIMDEDKVNQYALYMSMLGNRPDLFPTGSYPNASTTNPPLYYGIPPEALSDETFAALITEAEKYLGYPYVWGGSTPSSSFDCSGFVCWVLNNSGVYSIGRTTANGIMNECAIIPRSEAKPGDLIFFQGTYATSGASHVGIYVGNGMMIHCGNPISYASIDSNYWTSHFLAFGRLNYN